MEYWIDGYNVIGRSRTLRELSLEAARDRLLRAVVPLQAPVRIFFDASKPGAPTGQASATPDPRVRVTFVRQGTADDAMITALRGTKAGTITVVTEDRELRGKARQLGAVTVAVDKFLEKLELILAPPVHKSSPASPAPSGDKPLRESKKEIDEWLRIFSTPDDPPDPSSPRRIR